jgi:hypothetical protein
MGRYYHRHDGFVVSNNESDSFGEVDVSMRDFEQDSDEGSDEESTSSMIEIDDDAYGDTAMLSNDNNYLDIDVGS